MTPDERIQVESTRATAAAEPGRWAVLEAIVASTVGTTIEWYDFFLYGTAAALVFPHLFFPPEDAFVAQIMSFGTFALGFIARPLGGVIFGHLGDRIGRKSSLVATLLLMGVSTLLIGFLPTYEQIGVAAPLLLTSLRVIQGIGVGGEWGGAVLLALEFGHRGKRGFFAAWPQAGVPLGLLLSTGAFALFQALAGDGFTDWGWRVPFYLSGLLIVVGFLIRLRILETPLFQRLKETNQVARAPVAEALKLYWPQILLAAGARINENACFYLFSVYIIAYVQDVLHADSAVALLAVNVAAAVELFTIPLFGMLSDHLSRRGTYVAGCLFLIGFALPYYALLQTKEPAAIVAATVIALAGGHALLYSVQASMIPELFGTRTRYTAASIAYQLSAPVAGGLAPLIAATLTEYFPGHFWPLAQYVVLISVISMVCVLFLAETSRKDISADLPP